MDGEMNIIAQGPDPVGLATTVDKIIHALAQLQPGDPFLFLGMPKSSDKVQFIGAMATEDFLTALDVIKIALDGIQAANEAAGQNQETMQ